MRSFMQSKRVTFLFNTIQSNKYQAHKQQQHTANPYTIPMSSDNLKQQTLDQFIGILGQFLTAAQTVWPECGTLREFKAGFDLATNSALGNTGKLKIIEEYYQSISPFFDRCRAKDASVFTENSIEFLVKIDMKQKWEDQSVSDDTRNTVWQYIFELNRLSQMHQDLFNKIPENTLGKIQTTANRLAERMQSGELDYNNISLSQLGEEVLGDITPEEMEEFQRNLMSDPAAIMQLTQSLAPGIDPSMVMGMMMSAQGGGGSMAPPDNLGAIMSMLGGMQQQGNRQ